MENFTPFASLAGGVLIGLSASALLLFHGRVAGISGIFARALDFEDGGPWRLAFVIGLLGAGGAVGFLFPPLFAVTYVRTPAMIAVAGLLVGFGVRMGSGCTSGHGVCGISRFSPRSIVATLTFIATGALTVALLRALFGQP